MLSKYKKGEHHQDCTWWYVQKNMIVWYGTATTYYVGGNIGGDIPTKKCQCWLVWSKATVFPSAMRSSQRNLPKWILKQKNLQKKSVDEVDSTYYTLKFKNLPFKTYPLIQISKK